MRLLINALLGILTSLSTCEAELLSSQYSSFGIKVSVSCSLLANFHERVLGGLACARGRKRCGSGAAPWE